VDKCSPLCYNKRVVRKANKKKTNNLEEIKMNKYEIIELINAHAKLSFAAGAENNLKGNEPKRQKHLKEIERLEKILNEME
jgi:hypothetical protein